MYISGEAGGAPFQTTMPHYWIYMYMYLYIHVSTLDREIFDA